MRWIECASPLNRYFRCFRNASVNRSAFYVLAPRGQKLTLWLFDLGLEHGIVSRARHAYVHWLLKQSRSLMPCQTPDV